MRVAFGSGLWLLLVRGAEIGVEVVSCEYQFNWRILQFLDLIIKCLDFEEAGCLGFARNCVARCASVFTGKTGFSSSSNWIEK